MNSLVLIDFSNYAYACWFPALAAQKADPKYDPHEVLKTNLTGKMSTLLKTLNERDQTKGNDILFVEDRKSARKYALWPSYKANRTPLEHDPRPEAKEYLKSLGYAAWAFSPDNEADDAIASIVYNTLPTRESIVICSSDRDLWQLKQNKVDIWQLTKDRFVTDEMIVEEFGVSQIGQIPVVKALWGDSGDNIPNAVPRMQKQLMPHVLDSADLDSFFGNIANFGVESKRCKELLTKGEAQVRLNYQLVKLDTNCEIRLN